MTSKNNLVNDRELEPVSFASPSVFIGLGSMCLLFVPVNAAFLQEEKLYRNRKFNKRHTFLSKTGQV